MLLLIGRLLFSLFLSIFPALVTLSHWGWLSPFAAVAVLLLLLFGVGILLGVWPRFSALAVAVWLAIFISTQLPFWKLSNLDQYIIRLIFMEGAILLGGALLLSSAGNGTYSVCSKELALFSKAGYSDLSALIGRIFIGGTLIWMAICTVAHWGVRIAFLEFGEVVFPELLSSLGIVVQFLSGVLILIGVWQRIAAALLVIDLIATLIFLDRPWMGASPFLFGHLALLGLFLILFTAPMGRWSLAHSAIRRH